MKGPYHALRGLVTRGADRFGNWCDRNADGSLRFRRPGARRAAGRLWQAAGSLAHAVKLLPRVDAYRLEGARWSVVWAGDRHLSHELEHLLFPAGASVVPLGRVPAWGLRRFVADRLVGADLVVCALPRTWPGSWRPRGSVLFTCPVFVNLTIGIAEPLEDLLRGRARRGLRAEWNRFQREGGRWRVTRDPADFEAFYRDMYLPHITARHGSRALVTALDDLSGSWIRAGGSLLLVSRGAHPVAGVTVRVVGSACILGEEGILASLESAGYSSGLQAALKCAGIEFAQSLGLTTLVLGRSLARLSDPVLLSKLRWSPEIQPAGRSLHPEWAFAASRAEGPVIDHLNRLGLLAFSGGRPCLVSIGPVTGDRKPLAEKIGRALVVEAGLSGRVQECPA